MVTTAPFATHTAVSTVCAVHGAAPLKAAASKITGNEERIIDVSCARRSQPSVVPSPRPSPWISAQGRRAITAGGERLASHRVDVRAPPLVREHPELESNASIVASARGALAKLPTAPAAGIRPLRMRSEPDPWVGGRPDPRCPLIVHDRTQ